MIHHRHLSAQFGHLSAGYVTPTITDAHQRAENAKTFLLIPDAQMLGGMVRHALVMRALRGYECYAVEVNGTWLVCERQPGMEDSRLLTPREWAIAHGYAR